MKWLIRIYFKLFPTYIETEVQLVSYSRADRLMKADSAWKLSKLEDSNQILGSVWICKKERIWS